MMNHSKTFGGIRHPAGRKALALLLAALMTLSTAAPAFADLFAFVEVEEEKPVYTEGVLTAYENGYEVKVTYLGPEVFKVRKQGKFRALRFSCTVVAGALFEGDKELQAWFSDDANHLPLAVMVPLRMGTVWAWLKGWEGLKFPLTAKK